MWSVFAVLFHVAVSKVLTSQLSRIFSVFVRSPFSPSTNVNLSARLLGTCCLWGVEARLLFDLLHRELVHLPSHPPRLRF